MIRWLQRLGAVAMSGVLMVACTVAPVYRPPASMSATRTAQGISEATQSIVHDTEGPEVALALQARYASTAISCAGGLPAVACSGLLMRATTRGPYRVWNPNPESRTPRGVSFSWLRHDAAFSGIVFNYTNGFIVVPYQTAASSPDRYTALEVQCVYAFDADTYGRTGGLRDGCSPHDTEARTDTKPCQAQGIFNSAQWLARYRVVANRYTMQCGFRISEGTPDAAAVFMALPGIRAALPDEIGLHDEVMVGAWARDDIRMPVEAFFFLKGSVAGQAEARANQADFQVFTGHWVPVIQVTLPTRAEGAASFIYAP